MGLGMFTCAAQHAPEPVKALRPGPCGAAATTVGYAGRALQVRRHRSIRSGYEYC